MPEELLYLSAQLEIEHNRLRSFTAAAVGATSSEESLSRTIRAQAPLILPILVEIRRVLSNFSSTGSEELHFVNGNNEPVELNNLQPSSYEALRVATEQLPYSALRDETASDIKSKLTWSLSEKTQLTEWLARLRHLNDSLHDLLDEHQLHVLKDEQRQTHMELLQVRDSVKDLKALAEAAYSSRQSAETRPHWLQTQDDELGDLASFKAFFALLLSQNASQKTSLQIAASHIKLQEQSSSRHGYRVARLVDPSSVPEDVWVTWHHQQPSNSRERAAQLSLVEELTALLMAPKPDDFRIPPCYGYCVLPEHEGEPGRIAVVLQKPPHVAKDVHPINLMDAITQIPQPSLTQRVALAQSIAKSLLYLHSVNWLHKALRSEVILLFPSPSETSLHLHHPYLTGFDYARRAR